MGSRKTKNPLAGTLAKQNRVGYALIDVVAKVYSRSFTGIVAERMSFCQGLRCLPFGMTSIVIFSLVLWPFLVHSHILALDSRPLRLVNGYAKDEACSADRDLSPAGQASPSQKNRIFRKRNPHAYSFFNRAGFPLFFRVERADDILESA